MDRAAINIVRVELEHLDQLVSLFDAYRVFYEQASDLEGARHFLSARIAASESVIFMAELVSGNESSPAGFVQLYPSFSSVSMRRLWILNDLYVRPSMRRRGIARALMDRAWIYAVDTGAKGLELATARDNVPARQLYEALGYSLDDVFVHYHLYFNVGAGK